MTTPVPAAELIAERSYGGQPTARILCPYCGRTHLHLWPTDPTTPIVGHCGGVYTIGHRIKPASAKHGGTRKGKGNPAMTTTNTHDEPGHRFIEMADGTIVGPTKHRYQLDDAVQTPEWAGMSTIVGLIPARNDLNGNFPADRRESYGRERENGPVSGTGPLYVVNEGNVYSEAYEAVYSESELQPFAPAVAVE
jgi:hypothetical protein